MESLEQLLIDLGEVCWWWWWWCGGGGLCTAVNVKMGPASVSVCLQFIWKGKPYSAKRSNGSGSFRNSGKSPWALKGPKMVSFKQWILN